MHLIVALLSLLALPFAAAWTRNVTVGANGQLVFNPPNITAEVGDTIVFIFESEHTATQSTYQTPCSPSSGGFNGVSASTSPSTFSVKVNNTNPIWVYCAIPGHCKAGMVFAVNAPTTGDTYESFKQIAAGTGPGVEINPSSAGASPTGSSGGSNAGPDSVPSSANRVVSRASVLVTAFSALIALFV
ncbi:hypothetical protein BOTBODRAFT_51811 [Botryobasidium botryosum FD-172 SS1]|uniref:Phytocyanin domain-containing protein n=1 Tax=Botryobasidium botryosum (strain FD-172 SS1) TaxID=930990 RepID=A0A067MXI4_BOTB1|nr:hypothetical protein BOTBODRAFT_51811 [Botryobasidium botryosum FD-172 SS1]